MKNNTSWYNRPVAADWPRRAFGSIFKIADYVFKFTTLQILIGALIILGQKPGGKETIILAKILGVVTFLS